MLHATVRTAFSCIPRSPCTRLPYTQTLSTLHTLLSPPASISFQQRSVHLKTKPGTANAIPKLLINHQIKARRIVVIDENGKNKGEMDLYGAIEEAKSKKLDLMCVSPKSDPPICKIYSYGKYKYENRGKGKVVSPKTKEIRFGDKIAEHDVTNKMNTVKKFLLQMITVKITIVCEGEFDGSLAQAMIDNLYSRVSHFSKRESDINVNNRWASCTFFPIQEKVNMMKANPDLTPDEMADQEAFRATKKAAKEAAKTNQKTNVLQTHTTNGTVTKEDKESENEKDEPDETDEDEADENETDDRDALSPPAPFATSGSQAPEHAKQITQILSQLTKDGNKPQSHFKPPWNKTSQPSSQYSANIQASSNLQSIQTSNNQPNKQHNFNQPNTNRRFNSSSKFNQTPNFNTNKNQNYQQPTTQPTAAQKETTNK